MSSFTLGQRNTSAPTASSLMKQLPARQAFSHFFIEDDVNARVQSIGRVVRDVFDATPLAMVIAVLRAYRAERSTSRSTASTTAVHADGRQEGSTD